MGVTAFLAYLIHPEKHITTTFFSEWVSLKTAKAAITKKQSIQEKE